MVREADEVELGGCGESDRGVAGVEGTTEAAKCGGLARWDFRLRPGGVPGWKDRERRGGARASPPYHSLDGSPLGSGAAHVRTAYLQPGSFTVCPGG